MTILMISFRNHYGISCSATNAKPVFVLVGTTPVMNLLNLDLIRWNIKFDYKNAFVLDVTYEEAQPITLGFKSYGKQTIKGK